MLGPDTRLADRFGGQGGITIVEVMIAALVLVIGVLGALQLLDASTRAVHRAERGQVAVNRAQAELEQIRLLPYEQVALTSAPAPSPDESNPRNRVTTSCSAQGVSGAGCFALNRNGTNRAPMVVEGDTLEAEGQVTGASVAPGPDPFTSGDVAGEVFRFVVWQDDPSCAAPACPGTQDLKRVVVAVTIDDVAVVASRPYRELQSEFVDPEAGRDIEPSPPGAGQTEAQELWLTDTPCSTATRQAPVTDHPLHNTLGACSDGSQTGSSSGAPDLLLPAPPQLDPAFPDGGQPLYDYAGDVEPAVNPGGDRGIQLRERTAAGCEYAPSGTDAHEKVHRWVTEPMAPGFTYVLEENATLDLWTRTLGDDVLQAGELCVFVFVREDDVNGAAVDTLIGDADNPPNTFFRYSSGSWPTAGWGTANVQLRLEPPPGETVVRVLPGQRLGLAIALERDGTGPEDALQLMYEHPDFDSRLEVETTTPIPAS